MTVPSCLLRSAILLFSALSVSGQKVGSVWMQRLVPSKARIIETAELRTAKGDVRLLVLWMVAPERVVRRGDTGCSDWVYGDHWYGPARLSLVDPDQKKIINTLEIRGNYEGSGERAPGFPIPFYVSDEFYHVPRADKSKEGKPRILNLRDLTGEGVVAQFVLFEYQTCGSALTTVLGYSSRTGTAVQFRLEISERGERREIVSWVPHVFSEVPIRPGYWNFKWEPGHGANCWIHEEITFDPVRQIFVDHRKVIPYPGAAVPKALQTNKQ